MKKLSLPKTLAVTVVTSTLLGCTSPDLKPGEKPCTLYCSTDAALAEAQSDMFAGDPVPEFTDDAGSCHFSYC